VADRGYTWRFYRICAIRPPLSRSIGVKHELRRGRLSVNFIRYRDEDLRYDDVPASSFVPIGSSRFAVARVKLAQGDAGNHRAEASMPFGISVYGYGQYTSYWYPVVSTSPRSPFPDRAILASPSGA
jgi:hypothetical protein